MRWSAWELAILEEDVGRPDSVDAETAPGVGRTDVGEAVAVLVDDIAFVGIERDREDAAIAQPEHLGAGGAAVVIAVGPEQERRETGVGMVDVPVAIATIGFEIELAERDVPVGTGAAVTENRCVTE